MGSVAPTVRRLPRAEAALTGQVFSPETLAKAGEIAAQEISPIDDTRSTAWYRRQIANVLLQDAVTALWQRAGRQPWAQRSTVPAARAIQTQPMPGTLERSARREIELKVNGRVMRAWVGPNELLLNVLRDKLGMTGAKYGCGVGECGACTVLVDGKAMMGCLILAVAADGHEITTVEGLRTKDGSLDPLQQQFIDDAAFQCGYCTPGFLMATKGLLNEIPHPTEAEVRDYLEGNLCRCTGYVSIVRAVMNYTKKNA
jgi:aerobic-type carbon monoxide dehydrogenase small subunit (CoxS/CutS family)